MKKNEVSNNKGFSLVELIVVIAIMAVLVGVLAPAFIRYVEKSRQATDLQNLDSALESVKSYCADKDNLTGVTVTLTLDQPAAASNAAIQTAIQQDLADSAITTTAGGNLPLKGNSWTTVPSVVYTCDGSAAPAYTADSKFYQATGGTSIDPK